MHDILTKDDLRARTDEFISWNIEFGYFFNSYSK